MTSAAQAPGQEGHGFQDLSTVELPAEARDRLVASSRDEMVSDHSVVVALNWWQEALRQRGLKGGPVTGVHDGETTTSGRASVSRRDLFALAADANADESGESALRLLWHALAWGVGTRARNMNRRLDAIAASPDFPHVLREAGLVAAENPAQAFALLRPGRRNTVSWLGPAFFTKYLYFAGGGRPEHPAVILDAKVAFSLNRYGWSSLHTGGPWPTVTYDRYCRLLGRWAAELSSSGTRVAADQIEMWLFDNGELPS